jgi:hypothetical protein
LIASFIVEVAPGATAAGVNDFKTVTVLESVALAAIVLVTFCVLVSAPTGIVFVYVPFVLVVTFTVIVHAVPPAGMVAALNARLVPFGAAVSEPAHPVPDRTALGVAVLVIPAGYVSVNAALVSATVLAFVSVIVITLVAPGAIAAGLKLFVNAGGGLITCTSSAVDDAEA